VNVEGISISGTDAGNYTFNTTTDTTADIIPAPFNVNAGADQTVNEGEAVNFDGSYTDPGYPVQPTIAWIFGDGGTVEGTLAPTHAYADNGIYNVTLTVTYAEWSATSSDTMTVTVTNVAPTVTADPTDQAVQYSDPVDDVTFTGTVTFTAIDVPADVLSAAVSWKLDGGTTFIDGLPDAHTIEPDPGSLVFAEDPNQTNTWTLSGIADLAPDAYIIRVTVTDDDNDTGFVDTRIVVEPEDAVATYTGVMFVSTPSVKSGETTVELRASVQDITAVDPDSDPHAGDVQNARVTFYADGVAIAENLPVALVDPADPKTGVAAYPWDVDIGSADSETYEISVRIESSADPSADPSYYTGADEHILVTVSKPLNNSVTGGGYLVNEECCLGLYAPDPGLRTNFGFNVKYNKQGTNVQGNVNFILRQDGEVYQIKTNATDYLVIDPNDTRKAEFISKANLNKITDPAIPISIAGNLTLITTITDNGTPGHGDSIAITLWDGNTLLFSNQWDEIQTVEQLLDGGNLVVRAEVENLRLDGIHRSNREDSAGNLGSDMLLPVVQQAIGYWDSLGTYAATDDLAARLNVRVADLSDDRLGSTFGNTIWIDTDAAGYGWTCGAPLDNGRQAGRVDLLSVVTHEIGHVLGADHDTLGATLRLDERHLPLRSQAANGSFTQAAYAAVEWYDAPGYDLSQEALLRPSIFNPRSHRQGMSESLVLEKIFETGYSDIVQAEPVIVEQRPVGHAEFASRVDALLAALDDWDDDEVEMEAFSEDFIDEKLIDLLFGEDFD
jgi:PKD repeat protein